MRERLLRGDGFEHDRSRREDFDPIAEGKRYGLAPEISIALWEHVRREATNSDGLCDEKAARERFAQLAELIARRGGQLGPEPFHWTEIDAASGRVRHGNLLGERVPGRTTLVLAEASARARVALHGVSGRATLVANHVDSDIGSLDESRGFFRRYVSGGHAARAKLEGAISARDHHAAVIATSALKQDVASARRHLGNGLERDEGLRAELAALECPVEQLLAKLPNMSAGGQPWALWGPSSAEWRAAIGDDVERADGQLQADADPLGRHKIDKKGADPRKQARRGEPGRWPPLLSPGKRALTDGMSSVQMKRTPGSAVSTDAVHDAAARGVMTTTTALPFGDRIQESFGPEHDISKIVAHIGGDAPLAMGAEAFAFGSHVVFGASPDLHTAAHEAAHVIQQAHGVNLHGGVGEAGDAYERQADAVADRVVAGLSAADLLGSATRSATSQSAAVQMKPAAHTPAKQCDFVIPLPQDSFTVSFELLSAGAGDVRVAIAPANFSRAYQSELK